MNSEVNNEIVQEHALAVFTTLRTQYQQKKYLDVTIVTKDANEIPAHRSVLAACSRYFDQKFPTEVDGNSQRIVLNEINGQIAKELVGFCYTGTLKIDMENVKELILAATQLQFKIIERKCKQYLMKQMALQPEICFFVQSIDIFQKYNQLRTMAKYYALNYFSKISNFEYFNRLNIDKVIKILSDDNLVVKNEMEVFNAVIAWINFDVNNRKPCLFHLLKCVRYNDVDDTIFHGPIRDAFRSSKCTRFYNRLLQKRANLSKSPSLIAGFNFSPRTTYRTKLMAVINVGYQLVIKRFCYATQEWIYTGLITTPKLIDGQMRLIDAAHNKIYFFLSSLDGDMVATVNPDTLQVDVDMDHRIKINQDSDCSPIMMKMKDKLYVFVCRCHYDIYNTQDESSIRENGRFKIIYLPRRMHDATAVEFMGSFYFICMKSNQVHSFNPENSSWEEIKSMQSIRKEPRAAVYNGFLYVISSDDLLNRTTVEKYDPNTKTWTMVFSILDRLDCLSISLVAVDDGLICSGYSYIRNCHVQMKYNPEAGIWTVFAKIRRGKDYHVTLLSIIN